MKLKNILFLDIETVSGYSDFDKLPVNMQDFWTKKSTNLKLENPPKQTYFEKAAIYAEFGKVVCIGLGGIIDDQKQTFKLSYIAENSEKEALTKFKKVLEGHPAGSDLILCAHNGKEFDFPYLCRRMLINGIKLPSVLDNSTKKPWEILHLDTLEFWKFGDYKNFTSLDLLASLFDIPSPKAGMDGSQVNDCYYLGNDIEKICKYCMNDVLTLAQLYLKLNGRDLILTENIITSR